MSKTFRANPTSDKYNLKKRVNDIEATPAAATTVDLSSYVRNDGSDEITSPNPITLEVSTNSSENDDDASLKITKYNTDGTTVRNQIEFIPTRINAEYRCKNDLAIYINNNLKAQFGNHSTLFHSPVVVQKSYGIPPSSDYVGWQGAIGYDGNYLYICIQGKSIYTTAEGEFEVGNVKVPSDGVYIWKRIPWHPDSW